jgi:hypothetical protein
MSFDFHPKTLKSSHAVSSPPLSIPPRSTSSTPVSSAAATMLYVGNLHRRSLPRMVPLCLPTAGLLVRKVIIIQLQKEYNVTVW